MISKFFINRPIVAIVIAIVTVIGGLVAMAGLPVAQFPDIVPPTVVVSTTYPGANPQVIEAWKSFGQLSGDRNEADLASALEQGFRSAGWKGALTKAIEVRQAQRKSGYSPACELAAFYTELGDKEEAFRWLNTAYQERDMSLLGLKTNFVFDPLRSDPRFAELVRKVGLPQ